MKYNLIIPLRLPGLNEYTKANRTNKYVGANLKKTNRELYRICNFVTVEITYSKSSVAKI